MTKVQIWVTCLLLCICSIQTIDEVDIKYYQYILSHMKASNIKSNMKHLAKLPKHPGSKRSTDLAKYIAKQWLDDGFDKVEEFPYNIYLSYPVTPGEIHLLKHGDVKRKMVIKNEPPYHSSEKRGNPIYPFNAYSPSGDITAEVVYGNYGRPEDFEKLHQLGVDVSKKIVILRYGKCTRGDKVLQAELRGALGVILYTDPDDYGMPVGQEYPKGKGLNKHGVQRGTINRLTGDALSLGYPSKPGYFRVKEEKYKGNPNIMSQPISYASAYEILQFMTNTSIPTPQDFQGGLNVPYALQSGSNSTVRLKVDTTRESRESLTVCASLFGRQEPDRYVVLGSHRDSWVYGASDGTSGSATLIEIVRILGHMRRALGWRPRRSVMACSWGAEEVGTLGSSEWADENRNFLMNHVVAYLNADMLVHGDYVAQIGALEFLRRGLEEAAKLVSAPHGENDTANDEGRSMFEDWSTKSFVSGATSIRNRPHLETPYSYSDYKSLWHTYGTTIADFQHTFNREDGFGIGVYHTLYDSLHWLEKFIDPKFNIHLAMGQFQAGYALLVADSVIVPFDVVAYTEQIEVYLKEFEAAYKTMLANNNVSLTLAYERLEALQEKAKAFQKYVTDQHQLKSMYEIRSINDKLFQFEQNFLVSGISTKRSAQHVIYSTISFKLKPTKFPGISEAIYFASKNSDDDWDEVRKQITLVAWCFDTANRALDVDEWTY